MRTGSVVLWLAVLGGFLPGVARAQGPRPEDVSSIDGITQAVYQAISGPAGAPRDWARFRPLFHPGARLIPTGRQNGVGVATSLTVEEFITRATPGMEGQGWDGARWWIMTIFWEAETPGTPIPERLLRAP